MTRTVSMRGTVFRPVPLVLTVFALLAALAGAAVATASPTAAVRSRSNPSMLWLVSRDRAVVTAVDPVAGRPVAEISFPSAALRVSTLGADAIALQTDSRQVSRLNGDSLSAGRSIGLRIKGFEPSDVALGRFAVAVDRRHGRVTVLGGDRAVDLGAPITSTAVDDDGVVWVLAGGVGSVLAVGQRPSAAVRVCSRDCTLTVVDGRAVAIDRAAGRVRAIRLVDASVRTDAVPTPVPAQGSVIAGHSRGSIANYRPDDGVVSADGDRFALPRQAAGKVSGLAVTDDHVVLTAPGQVLVIDRATGRSTRVALRASDSGRTERTDDLELIELPAAVVVNDPWSDQAVAVTADGVRRFSKYDPTIKAQALRPGQEPKAPAPPKAATPPTTPTTGTPTPSGTPTASSNATPTTQPTAASVPTVKVTAPAPQPATASRPSPTGQPSLPPAPASAPTKPAPTKPVPTKPVPTKPVPTQSTPPISAPANPAADQPTPTKTQPAAAPGAPRLSVEPGGDGLSLTAVIAAGDGGPVEHFSLTVTGSGATIYSSEVAAGSTKVQLPGCGQYNAVARAHGPGGVAGSAPVTVAACPALGELKGLSVTGRLDGRADITWTPIAPMPGRDVTGVVDVSTNQGTQRVSIGGADRSVTVAGLGTNTDARVTLTLTDNWGHQTRAETTGHTLPGVVGVCQAREGNWFTYSNCPTAGADFLLFDAPDPGHGITAEVRQERIGATIGPINSKDRPLLIARDGASVLPGFGDITPSHYVDQDDNGGRPLGFASAGPVGADTRALFSFYDGGNWFYTTDAATAGAAAARGMINVPR